MRIRLAKHLPALVTTVMMVSIIAWISMHPKVVARFSSGIVSSKLLHIDGGGLRVNDFKVRPFEGMDLYGVSLTLPGADGGMTLISADTVVVDFTLREALGNVPHFRRVRISNPEVFTKVGSDTSEEVDLQLPSIIIDHLQVSDGYLEFSTSEGRISERIGRLDWRGRVVMEDDTIDLDLWGCDVLWDTHASALTDLRGEIRIDSSAVGVSSLVGLLNGHRVEVSGSRAWSTDLDLAVTATNVNIPEVENLIDMDIGFAAQGNMVATFVTQGDSLIFDGSFSGELEGYDISKVTGKAAITEESVFLYDLEGTINGADFMGGGVFDISSPMAVNFFLEGDVSQVDIKKGLIPGEEELPQTNGWGRIRIDHSDLPLWTRVTGMLYDGYIETIPFDSCYVDVEAYADSVVFNNIDLDYNDLRVVLTGTSNNSRVFSGDVHGYSSNLGSLPTQWNLPPLSGALTIQGQLLGLLDDLSFDGDADATNFSLDILAAKTFSTQLQIEDILEDPIFTASITGDGISLGEVPFGEFQFSGAASQYSARVDGFSADYGDTSVGFSFVADFTDSIASFNVPSFDVSLEGTDWVLASFASFDIGKNYFVLPHLNLVSQQGSLLMDADYRSGESVDGSLILNNFTLGLLDPFVTNEKPLSGLLSAALFVDGSPNDPLVSLEASLQEAHFDLANIDSLVVEASFQSGILDIEHLDMSTNFGHVIAGGTLSHPGAGFATFWPGAALGLKVEIPEGDFAFMEQFELLALDRLAGQFNGEVEITGTTLDPLIVGSLHSSPFHIHWLHMDELTGRVRLDREALVLGGLKGNQDSLEFTARIEIPMEFDLVSEPIAPLDGQFFMQLNIPPGSDFEPLSRATNAFISSSGSGWANVTIVGPLEQPSYQGNVVIENADFVLVNLEEIYSDTSCEGTFQGDVLKVKNIRGKEGLAGTFSGDGSVVFKGLELVNFDINLELDRFLVASIPDVRALIKSSNAQLVGAKVGADSLLVVKFLGDVDVIEARYTGDFSEGGSGAVADPILPTDSPEWLANMRLHGSPRSLRIHNRELELFLGGDLNLVRDLEGLNLRGTLDVNSGKLIVFNNSFDVQRGRLDFSRELGFDPRIDLAADTEYRRRSQHSTNSIIERIGVNVTGTLFKPIINFTSDRGYSREAIQRMLLGLDPNPGTGTDINRLRNSGIAAGFNILEREIARELDIFDTFEIDQIQRDSANVGETSIDPLIGVGKYIWADLYLKYAQGIRQDDRDFLVEFQINNHLLLQSEVRRRIDENQGQPTYNMDFKYRFEY